MIPRIYQASVGVTIDLECISYCLPPHKGSKGLSFVLKEKWFRFDLVEGHTYEGTLEEGQKLLEIWKAYHAQKQRLELASRAHIPSFLPDGKPLFSRRRAELALEFADALLGALEVTP